MATNPPGEDPPGDVFDYAEYVHDDYGAHVDEHFQGDRPGAERFASGEFPVERFPVAGPLAQNYPAETPYDNTPTDSFEATDYDNDYRGSVYDEFPLPGWETPDETETAPRTRRFRRPLLIAAVVVFLAGVTAAILIAPRWVGNEERTEAAGPRGVSGEKASGPVDGRAAARFELVDGAATVRVAADDLGDDLYRVTTPAGSDVTPKVEDSGDALRLLLPAGAKGAPKEVTIALNRAVRWTLKIDGGTAHTTVDLTGAEVDGVELSGGANRIDLTLPAPTALVPVRMTGGVDQWSMRLAGAPPVRVRVQSGAGAVTLAGTTHRGIAPGQSFTANGWQTDNPTGFDVQAVAGMSALTITGG